TGDLDNDLRVDLLVAKDQSIEIVFSATKPRLSLPLKGLHPRGILLVDYDNDGWLDGIAYGDGWRVWRNRGTAGFADVTGDVGLAKISQVGSIVAADFDGDGATDLVWSGGKGLEFWRNEGGNANRQIKIQLVGNRSNASALGVRVEATAGNWRTIRTLHQA